MSWRLPTDLFPELGRFKDKRARACAYKRACKSSRMVGWSVLVGVGVVVFVILMKELAPKLSQHPVVHVVLFVIGCSVPAYLTMWILRNAIQTALRRDLNAAGEPTCIGCGYDLRGQVDPRCPECGKSFEVTQTETRKAES